MKVLNGLRKVNLGSGDFYAITCGEIGAGRKLGFIPVCKSLVEEIDKKIEETKESYVKSSYDWSYNIIMGEDDLEERERRLKNLNEKYQEKYEIDILKKEAEQGILNNKEILEVLSNVKLIKTKRGGMLLVHNDTIDNYYLYATSLWGEYRGSVKENIIELEKEGNLEVLSNGVLADGLAGNMAWASQYIIKSNKKIEIEVIKDGRKCEKENVLVIDINGAKELSKKEYTTLKNIEEN